MLSELKRVGLVFTQEGAIDFKKTLQEINLEMNKNYNQFKLTQSQWDSSTKSTEKLKIQQEYLTNAYEIQQDKVNALKIQLSDLENSENKNTTAIKKKQNELVNAEIKLKNYENQLKEVVNKLENFGLKLTEAGEKVKKVGDKVEKAGKKMSAFSVATTIALVASAKSAIDFEEAFTGVEKTVDGTEKQMSELKQGVREMAKELPSTTSEISAVAEAAGQLGIKTENILSFSKAMIDLGNSTNLTADEAASQLAKFANIMQMSQKDFDKLGSSIVELGNNFATTEADIVDMSMRLAGAGKQVGLSEGQVLGLATALSSVGIEAEMGGSAISKAMVKMQNAVEQGGTKLNVVLGKTGMTLRNLELMSANDSKTFKELSQSIGMTSTEVKQLITAGTNLEDFANVSGMTAEQFKKAWKDDAAGALSEFIKGLGDAESKGESAITMLSEMGLTEVRLRDSLLRAANAGTLFNNAIETGTKSWEENTALTNEANKRYGTLKSQITITINKIKDFAITIGNKLMPQISKLTKGIENITNWFNKLTDEQVNTIVKIGLLVAAAGPLITTLGKITKITSSGIKVIGSFAQAIGVMKGTVSSTSTAVNVLAGAMTALGGPVGLTVTATIAALTTGIMAYYVATEKEKVSLGGLKEEVENQRKSWEDLKNVRNETLTSSMNEIDFCKRLTDELEKITDENGKIKEGYKSRAQVIINELNEALGTEYKINGQIIESYKEIKDNINQVIETKKAEAILNAYQAEYGDAIKREGEATKTLIELKQKLADTSKKMVEGTSLERAEAKQQFESIVREIEKQTDLIGECGKTIVNYEDLQKASVEGNAEKIKKATEDIMTSYESIKQKNQQTVEEQINTQSNYVKYLKESLSEATDNNKYYQETILKNQLETEQKKLDNLVESLTKQSETVESLSSEQLDAWKSIAEQSYLKYSEGLSKVSEKTRNEIEKATGIVATNVTLPDASEINASKSSMFFAQNLKFCDLAKDEIKNTSNIIKEDTSVEESTKELANEADKGFNNNIDSGKWGRDLTLELSNNMTNQTSKKTITNAASTVAKWISNFLHFSLPEKGPLSDMDKSMPDMIDLMSNGIDNNKTKLIKSVKNMSNEVKNELDTINEESKVNDTSNALLKNYNTHDTKYVFNMNVYPQKLDEAEFENIFNYINRRFGTSY